MSLVDDAGAAYNLTMQGYTMKSIRVFVVDDHDIVRRGLIDLLSVKRDITVVGESSSAGSAVQRILDLKPDVMVLDRQLQDGTGIQVCRKVRSVDPSIHGLLLTSASDDEALLATLLAGASGYGTKLVNTASILDGIRRIGVGHLIQRVTSQRGAA
jgi:two-component system response regulator DevR